MHLKHIKLLVNQTRLDEKLHLMQESAKRDCVICFKWQKKRVGDVKLVNTAPRRYKQKIVFVDTHYDKLRNIKFKIFSLQQK